jgi:hypothetical protein
MDKIAPRPSPDDILIVSNPLSQSFTIEYEHRFWTLESKEQAEHPRFLVEAFAREMATAIINRMGDVVRERIYNANPNITTHDANKELLKSEPRTNNLQLREKIIKKIVIGVKSLYPKEKERELDPKRETAISAGEDFYNPDQKIIMKITNKEYARLAGIDFQDDVQAGTSQITSDVSFVDKEPEVKPTATLSKEDKKEEEKVKKEEDSLVKEVIN